MKSGSASTKAVKPLCKSCRIFKITSNRFRGAPFTEARVHQLGKFVTIKARQCPLCQLVAEAYSDCHLTYEELSKSEVSGAWARISDTSEYAYLAMSLAEPYSTEKTELSIRICQNETVKRIGAGRIIASPYIDAKLVKQWLYRCEAQHGCQPVRLEATRAGALPTGFMVIDTLQMCLVVAQFPCRFLALSYVWGNSIKLMTTTHNADEFKRVGSFDRVWDRLSPVIRDAIVLTRTMGERYLWIDSLCIYQDNSANAIANIAAMDSIYRYALAVICAADDRAPVDGIAGIDSSSRSTKQYISEIMPGIEALARFNHNTIMAQTIYRSRGWTYQEEQLATRSIIFANNQCYFTCPKLVYAEDVQEGTDSEVDISLQSWQALYRYVRDDADPAWMYFKSVEMFTARKLSFDSDILNAFKGVEAVFCQITDTNSVMGHLTGSFDLALLWQPVGHSIRRKGFPSWSWAGWLGGVRWGGDTVPRNEFGYTSEVDAESQWINWWLQRHTWINWRHRSESCTVDPVWQPKTGGLQGGSVTDVGHSSAKQHVRNMYGGEFYLPESWKRYRECGQQNSNLLKEAADLSLDLHPLIFSTLVVAYRIENGGQYAYIRYGAMDPPWIANGRIVFLLKNCQDQVSGYVQLDESWTNTPTTTVHDFLVLSEASHSAEYGKPHHQHPYTQHNVGKLYEEYHIMMVKWSTINGVRVAERVGLGRLVNEAIEDSVTNPQWIDITLV